MLAVYQHMVLLIYGTKLTPHLIDTPNPKAQTSTLTILTPKSLVSHFRHLICSYLVSFNTAAAPKKKTKRTKPKDDEDDEDEEEEDDVSDDDDDDAAVPEEDDDDDDDDDDEDANPKGKKPAGAEKDRKVKTTGKADPVPVVDDDDDDE
jgi:cytoskeletal protein RodZ